MTRTVFTFDTTHHALWGEEIAREAGIPHEIVPAPPAANARCNIAIETLLEDAERFGSEMTDAGVTFGLYRES